MTQAMKSNRRKAAKLVLEKRGASVFVNGNRVLTARGPASLSRKDLRAAVRDVAQRRK
jgi:hypothetical protein